MKLKSKLNEVTTAFKSLIALNVDAFESHVQNVIASNAYNDLDRRIAWDLYRAAGLVKKAWAWIDETGCDDSALNTLFSLCL